MAHTTVYHYDKSGSYTGSTSTRPPIGCLGIMLFIGILIYTSLHPHVPGTSGTGPADYSDAHQYAKNYNHIIPKLRARGALMQYCGREEFCQSWSERKPDRAVVQRLENLIEAEDQGDERISAAEFALLSYCGKEIQHDPAEIKRLEGLVQQEQRRLDQLIDAELAKIPPPLHQ